MGEPVQQPGYEPAVTVYCTECSQGMRVSPAHVSMPVACPHCRTTLEPWRLAGMPPRTPSAPPHRPPPVPPGYTRRYGAGVSPRSRIVAGVLGILLGYFGVHRFYLGYTGVGVLQIILTFATGGIAGIWGFIEGILCLTTRDWCDADGLPLRD